MEIDVEGTIYTLKENYREAFDKDMFLARYTDYFENYDYIVGDIAYSKLRLKGFNKKNNKGLNKINDFENIKKYIAENCAYDCKYFILEKTSEKKGK
mgnify:CR=1 FL=1